MTDSTEPAPGSLKELVGHRWYWRWSAAAQAYRLSLIMAPIVFVLVATEQRGSLALGGVLVAVWTLAPAVVAPVAGRVYDRIGVDRWAPRMLVVVAVGLALIALGFNAGLAGPLLVALTGIVAAAGAGLAGCNRALLSECVPATLLPVALSLDASIIELVVITAPFVAVVTALIGPVVPVYAMAAITLVSAVLLRSLRAAAVPATSGNTSDAAVEVRPARSLWRNPRFYFWLMVAAAFGQSVGTLETGAVPLSDSFEAGSGQAAALIAILGVSSALSGLGYAVISRRLRLGQVSRSSVLMSIMMVAGIGLGFVDSLGPAIAGYIAVGLCTAPLNTVLFYSVELEVDPTRRTEAFSSVSTASAVGFAVPGALLALVPLPVTFGISGTFAACALMFAVVFSRHRTRAGKSPKVRVETAGAEPASGRGAWRPLQ